MESENVEIRKESSLKKETQQRRVNVKDIPSDDDDDDGLTDEERKFLRQVATGNEEGAIDSLDDGVNIHVKNTFER